MEGKQPNSSPGDISGAQATTHRAKSCFPEIAYFVESQMVGNTLEIVTASSMEQECDR